MVCCLSVCTVTIYLYLLITNKHKAIPLCIVSSIEILATQVKFQDFWQLPNSPFLRVTRVVSSLNVLDSFWYKNAIHGVSDI